jgi:hypothetical protein
VFIFAKESLSLADEIRALRTPTRPTLIVIDDYARHIDLISELRLGAGQNQYLLLTSRTPTHLTTRDRLLSALGDGQLVEFRVDTLREEELKTFDSILAGAGLLGEEAARSPDHRVQELYRSRGAGEFGGILLWLLDSPVIRERLAETFATLKGKDEPQRVVIAAMILTHIGQPPDIDDIAEFIGANAINQTIFSEGSTVAELVRLDRHVAYPRSSLFAVAALRSLWDQGQVSDVLEEMLRTAWRLRGNNKRFGISPVTSCATARLDRSFREMIPITTSLSITSRFGIWTRVLTMRFSGFNSVSLTSKQKSSTWQRSI